MANGDIIKLGTFYLNGAKQARPSYPWASASKPSGTSGYGNIPNYSSGNIEIKDTDSNDAYKIQWVEVNDGGKKLLIADRNLLVKASWDTLNAQRLISGKTITIDGQQYKLRLLTGGSNYRDDNYAGGTPNNNEWDRIICNEGSFSGLPTPNFDDLDKHSNATDLSGTHNSKWNWYCCYSWVQEASSQNSSYRVLRGYSSARSLSNGGSDGTGGNFGWRPVLEVLNTAPLISDNNRDLGIKNTSFSMNYTVDDVEKDTVKVEEKIDDNVVNTIESIELNKRQCMKIDITKLKIGDHKIEIIATDNKGGKSTRTYNFKVTAKKYKLTLDKNIESISNKQAEIIKFIPKINNKKLEIKQVEKDKIIYSISKLNTDTVNLEIEGNSCTLDKLSYVIY